MALLLHPGVLWDVIPSSKFLVNWQSDLDGWFGSGLLSLQGGFGVLGASCCTTSGGTRCSIVLPFLEGGSCSQADTSFIMLLVSSLPNDFSTHSLSLLRSIILLGVAKWCFKNPFYHFAFTSCSSLIKRHWPYEILVTIKYSLCRKGQKMLDFCPLYIFRKMS